jgi:hypothetical protein
MITSFLKTHLVTCTGFFPSIAQAIPFDFGQAPVQSHDWAGGAGVFGAVVLAGTVLAIVAWRVWTTVVEYQCGECTQSEASTRTRRAFLWAWVAVSAGIVAIH